MANQADIDVALNKGNWVKSFLDWLTEYITSLQRTVATRTSERDSAIADASQKADTIATLQARAGDLEGAIATLTAQKDAIQATANQLQTDLSAAEANVASVTALLTAEESENALLESQAQSLTAERDGLQTNLTTANSWVDQLTAKIGELRSAAAETDQADGSSESPPYLSTKPAPVLLIGGEGQLQWDGPTSPHNATEIQFAPDSATGWSDVYSTSNGTSYTETVYGLYRARFTNNLDTSIAPTQWSVPLVYEAPPPPPPPAEVTLMNGLSDDIEISPNGGADWYLIQGTATAPLGEPGILVMATQGDLMVRVVGSQYAGTINIGVPGQSGQFGYGPSGWGFTPAG
jgi:chaperonin cofactor prefoldin